jgi:hypothetical protein
MAGDSTAARARVQWVAKAGASRREAFGGGVVDFDFNDAARRGGMVLPSPFPGMAPYLEDPARWMSFRGRFITVLDEMVRPLVRPGFVVEQQEAVYLVAPSGIQRRHPILPDIHVSRAPAATGAVVASPITEPTIIRRHFPTEVRQRYLEIRDRASRMVVTIIEVLSPTNKDQGGDGFGQFEHKRREVMASPVHWIEIDLLRAGQRMYEMAGESDHGALLKRGMTSDAPPSGEDELEARYFGVRDPAPIIAVPLSRPWPDVALDLGAALATVYERHYAGDVDYLAAPPPPPLAIADALWVGERLRARYADQARA